MIQIIDKAQCCGCEACVQVCPQQCIIFQPDNEGFSYPQVNQDACIQCSLCEKVCSVLYPYKECKPQEVLAAINKDEGIRMASSSGGVFTILADEIIRQKGVVFGVRFDEKWRAVFDYAENKEQIKFFRGSKYLQAKVGNSFTICKKMLEEGRNVLFVGTPCQVAGLHHFLRKPYPNLLSIDFICHGVPSPKVWSHYLKEVTKNGKNSIIDIQFRDKSIGWKRFCLLLKYSKHGKSHTILSPHFQNTFMQAFLSNLILRPSCYSCPAKEGRSNADVTIADFWGIDKIEPQMSDDKGTSLVLIHTDKGKSFFNQENVRYIPASYEDVLHFNASVKTSAAMNPLRMEFFTSFCDDSNLHQLVTHLLHPTLKQRVKKKLYPIWMKILRFM